MTQTEFNPCNKTDKKNSSIHTYSSSIDKNIISGGKTGKKIIIFLIIIFIITLFILLFIANSIIEQNNNKYKIFSLITVFMLFPIIYCSIKYNDINKNILQAQKRISNINPKTCIYSHGIYVNGKYVSTDGSSISSYNKY